ncbi:Uncharacterised protein [Cedecea lapagei]|uniref:Eaa protein n=1 Tax=Cedecea lapagei TaxID=158823 RepID=A0A3S4J4L8_9ENTR|nr:eaa protein [Cedecea lapagei]VEC00271.1 Uncharacterised protein [Cedecea lapagei]
MATVCEKILKVMRDRKEQQKATIGSEWPVKMATWNLRLALEREYPEDDWSCKDLRKHLSEMQKEGLVSKCQYESRIGQAVWRLYE